MPRFVHTLRIVLDTCSRNGRLKYTERGGDSLHLKAHREGQRSDVWQLYSLSRGEGVGGGEGRGDEKQGFNYTVEPANPLQQYTVQPDPGIDPSNLLT